ncbi:MAG: hypothetical protein H6810_03315 [Phycisphaeraceae bacterium]|nr:MAG: hypothetical protein H6810_03315 [Phycisphaeraceae bacterium]
MTDPKPTAANATSQSGPSSAREMGGVVDRRSGLDRREIERSNGQPPTGLERRRGAGRRLSDFQRAADEGEMTPEQFMFLVAVDAFKQANRVTFPTWTDVLEIVRLLGYRKTMPSELNLRNAEDWCERPDAPSNVRPKGWERRFTKGELKELEELADYVRERDEAA